jgi:hypothetical protein
LIGYEEWSLVRSIYKTDAPRILLALEDIWKGFVSFGLHNILVSLPVIGMNLIGGFTMALAGGKIGINIFEYFSYVTEGLNKLKTVKALMNSSVQEFMQNPDLTLAVGDVSAHIMKTFNRKLKDMTGAEDIKDYADPVMFQSMLDDSILENVGGKNLFRDKVIDGVLASVLDKSIIGNKLLATVTTPLSVILSGSQKDVVMNKLWGDGAKAKDIFSEFFMMPDSISGKTLMTILQGSDFINRYAIYKGNVKQLSAIPDSGLSKSKIEAIAKARSLDYMVDYAKTLPQLPRAIGQYGIFPFVTFLLRTQRTFTKLIYDSYIGDEGYTALTSKEWYKAVGRNLEYRNIMRIGLTHTALWDYMESAVPSLRTESYDTFQAYIPTKIAMGTEWDKILPFSHIGNLTDPENIVKNVTPAFYRGMFEVASGTKDVPELFFRFDGSF